MAMALKLSMINNAMAALTREVEGQPNTPLSVCVAMSQHILGMTYKMPFTKSC